MSTELQILQNIQRDVAYLKQQARQTSHWVNAYRVKEVTGWTGEKMRQMREQGLIEYREKQLKKIPNTDKPGKKKKGSLEYKLESIPQVFIKKQNR